MGSHAATNSHRDITNRNQPLLFIHTDPTNSIVWTRKSFFGSLVSCRVGFRKTWGPKSVMNPSCQHNFLHHQQPQGHNKQEESTTLFIHMDPTNSIVCTRRSFIGSLVSCRVCFQQNLGQKSVMGSHAATNSHRDITNRNQPLLFIHMDPTNSIVWMRESFIGSLVSCRVGFQQNLGQKSVMDPSCQHRDITNRNEPLLFIHMDPTNMDDPAMTNKLILVLNYIMVSDKFSEKSLLLHQKYKMSWFV
jgi:hypothetical protein